MRCMIAPPDIDLFGQWLCDPANPNENGQHNMPLPRIRQLVFASLEATDIHKLKRILGLGQEFVDPGVGVFGLTNGVFAIGDQFLEVVVPVQDDTAAERFIQRTDGLGGYMAIFQTDRLDQVRNAADELGVRRVWNIDRADISASHLHPADIGAAIVSIDEAHPPGSWLWGGPDWQDRTTPGAISRLEVTCKDPDVMSRKWAQIIGTVATPAQNGIYDIQFPDDAIRFLPGDRDYLSAFHLLHPKPDDCLKRAVAEDLPVSGNSLHIMGVDVVIETIDPARMRAKTHE